MPAQTNIKGFSENPNMVFSNRDLSTSMTPLIYLSSQMLPFLSYLDDIDSSYVSNNCFHLTWNLKKNNMYIPIVSSGSTCIASEF